MGCFIATTLGLCGVVSMYYPDRPSVPRTFPGGLDRELGGEGAVWVRVGPVLLQGC
jgi:NADH dehydrogenase (ubiquinone) 1 beta subcomplex subunit 8